jgi:hypothetical protein
MKAEIMAHMSRGQGLTFVAVVLALVAGVSSSGTPRELGNVDWSRSFDSALERARATGHPLFVLFQEVPGCNTCVSFGEQVLTHPLLIEGIEEEFVPVAIYNNRSGADRAVVERYGEQPWNNPVVRFLDSDGRDLVPRRAGLWTPEAIGHRMVLALESAGRPVPPYLRAAIEELQTSGARQATFGMDCYWSGEACLGTIPGLLSSRTGVLGGREVVEVVYDPGDVEYRQLLKEARSRGCADHVFAHDAEQLEAAQRVFGNAATRTRTLAESAAERDQKYYLRRSRFLKLELTPRQAMRVNAALASVENPLRWLSPRQRKLLE